MTFMKWFAAFIFFSVVVRRIDCASNGALGNGAPFCWNANWEIGCHPDDWIDSDRLRCSSNFPMNWAMKPRYTSAFSLSILGEEKESYIPSKYLTLALTVKKYPFKYRGLVCHATDDDGAMVGEWTRTVIGVQSQFWNPTAQRECIMHRQGDLKPLKAIFRFKAPVAGTGKIRFQCLIKTGPANEGYFFYPNGHFLIGFDDIPDENTNRGGFPGNGTDLILEESLSSTHSVWSLSALGESCSTHCKNLGLSCDSEALKNISSEHGMERVSGVSGCALPYRPSCASVVPAIDGDEVCWYNGLDAKIGGVCLEEQTDDSARADCTSKHSHARRICVCKNKEDLQMQESDLKSTTTHMSTIFLISLSLVVFGAMKIHRLSIRPISMFFFSVCLLTPGVESHNWLTTWGRASNEASTTNPARQRRFTDIHAQIGPGQKMAIASATGHIRDQFWVFLNGADATEMYKDSYKESVKEYIKRVEDGFETNHYSTKGPRLTVCANPGCDSEPDKFEEVLPSDPSYCTHPKFNGRKIYRWKDNPRDAEHVWAEYFNPKFPWIIGAIKVPPFEHRPADSAMFCVGINKRPGTGNHHIAHWWFAGYYDVVDVHVFDEQVDETVIYGNDTGEFLLTRTDHCQFIKPQGFVSPIRDATFNLTECIQDLHDGFQKYPNFIDGTLGMNVVPVVNKGAVGTDHESIVAIPTNLNEDPYENDFDWPDDYFQTVLNSDFMNLTGNITGIAYDWASFGVNGAQFGKRCRRKPIYIEKSMAEALSECLSLNNCHGLAWRRMGSPLSDLWPGNGTDLEIVVCQDTNTNVPNDDDWVYFARPDSTLPENYQDPSTWNADAIWNVSSNTRTHLSYKISFQPLDGSRYFKNQPVHLGWARREEWIVDHGKKFGHNYNGNVYNQSVKFGWKCTVDPQHLQINTRNLNHSHFQESLLGPHTSYMSVDMWYEKCESGMNAWEIEVPNGVYAVTVYTSHSRMVNMGNQCSIENRRFTTGYDNNAKAISVEVVDGKLTLTADGGIFKSPTETEFMYCPAIYWIRIDRLMDSFPEAWVPKPLFDVNPWTQVEIKDESVPIGFVTIILPGQVATKTETYPFSGQNTMSSLFETFFMEPHTKTDMQNWFLLDYENRENFPGSDEDLFSKATLNRSAYGSNIVSVSTTPQALGKYIDDENHGAIFAVSNTSCTQSEGCTGTEIVCATILKIHSCESFSNDTCPYMINCNGAVGKYFRLYLKAKSSQRFLMTTEVRAHRQSIPTKILSPEKEAMVCYGIEARTATATSPSFVISEDPFDPIFYSTCLTYSRNIKWLNIPQVAPPKPKYIFDTTCLSCDSFYGNLNLSENDTAHWYLDNVCKLCGGHADAAVWGEGNIDSATSSPATCSPTTETPSTWQPTVDPTTRTPFTWQPTLNPTTGSPSFLSGCPTLSPSFNPISYPTLHSTQHPSSNPTYHPSSTPSSSPSFFLALYEVRIVLDMDIVTITEAFKRNMESEITQLLIINPGDIRLFFLAGSVVMKTQFINSNNAHQAAKVLSKYTTTRLQQSLNVNQTIISIGEAIQVGTDIKEPIRTDTKNTNMVIIISIMSGVGAIVVVALSLWCICKRNCRWNETTEASDSKETRQRISSIPEALRSGKSHICKLNASEDEKSTSLYATSGQEWLKVANNKGTGSSCNSRTNVLRSARSIGNLVMDI